MAKSKIEWTENTWNPVTGCDPVSPGCENCYAARMAKRLRGQCGYPEVNPFQVTLHSNRLDQPIRWKKPRRIFICLMGDLFHEDVPDDYILKVLETVRQCFQHTFILLTKRANRMKLFLSKNPFGNVFYNLALGVSVENQKTADERIPYLLETPAACRIVSAEPLLEYVGLAGYIGDLDGVIVGGETGPGARPMHPDWACSIRDGCQLAKVSFFFKQWGAFLPKSQMIPGVHIGVGEEPGSNDEFVKTCQKNRVLDGRTWDEFPEIAT